MQIYFRQANSNITKQWRDN